jgi:hypothetical protein
MESVGGITVESGGVVVESGGVTVESGGATVESGGGVTVESVGEVIVESPGTDVSSVGSKASEEGPTLSPAQAAAAARNKLPMTARNRAPRDGEPEGLIIGVRSPSWWFEEYRHTVVGP